MTTVHVLYFMFVLFGALSRKVGALKMSFIIMNEWKFIYGA